MTPEPIPPRTDHVASQVVDAAFAVHSTLGRGLLESVYEACLAEELLERGLRFRRQVPFPVTYKSVRLDGGFRMDLVVEERRSSSSSRPWNNSPRCTGPKS